MPALKKYQVFISSTYEDLKEERRAVEESIIRAGDFPVGMEAFPAADEEIFDFIKTIIIGCDYYVLIIGGRYGQISPDGFSYTEKEYDYAVAQGIPVLVMMHGSRATLPANKVERSEEGQQALEKFIVKASTGRIRKEWNTTDGLKLAIREALDHAKATKPRIGWIKGDSSVDVDVLSDLNKLRKEKQELEAKLDSLIAPKLTTFDPAGLSAQVKLQGKYRYYDSRNSTHSQIWTKTVSLNTLFSMLAPHLIDAKNEISVPNIVGEQNVKYKDYGKPLEDSARVDDETLIQIRIQLEAAGLLKVFRSKTANGGVGTFWQLTELGKREMYERRVIPKEIPGHPS